MDHDPLTCPYCRIVTDVTEQVSLLLKSRDQAWAPAQMARELGQDQNTVRQAVYRLYRRGRVIRHTQGRYTWNHDREG